jgi:hypothetical protein
MDGVLWENPKGLAALLGAGGIVPGPATPAIAMPPLSSPSLPGDDKPANYESVFWATELVIEADTVLQFTVVTTGVVEVVILSVFICMGLLVCLLIVQL